MHCRAGLGRTGTLIALWMMRGTWKAREAIAWLRIVRPGSVLGIQQEYLEACEDPLRSGRLILDIDIAALLNEVACMYVRMYVCMYVLVYITYLGIARALSQGFWVPASQSSQCHACRVCQEGARARVVT